MSAELLRLPLPAGDNGDGRTGAAHALLEAIVAIASDLDLHLVLTRIVEAATELTGARYGALGVIGPDGHTLADFVTTGIGADEREQIGDLPSGHGILGLLIEHPQVLRLDDLTQHPAYAGFPAHHPPMTAFLGMPIRIRGTVFGNLYLTEKSGGSVFTEQDELLVRGLATAAGFVIENARAYGRSERRRQWLEASTELAESLSLPMSIDEALERLVQSARTTSSAVAAAVVDEGDGLPRAVDVDPEDADRVARALAGVAGALREEDVIELHVDGLVTIAVPLRSQLSRPGVLVVMFERGLDLGGTEERVLLVSFADQAALALDRVVALADREELAVISDRERIARDLHDSVIQRLFATGLHLQGTAMIAESSQIGARLEQAVGDLDLTIGDIRGTIFELQHHSADSLRAELRAVAREYAPALGFGPVVRTSGPVDIAVPARVREHLVPVLREAVSNVARHARARHVAVELHVDDAEVHLLVRDDGIGVSAGVVESGLRNARDRAHALDGSLEVGPLEPRGTAFSWRAPMRRD
jgi:signal transduction histidine kinase